MASCRLTGGGGHVRGNACEAGEGGKPGPEGVFECSREGDGSLTGGRNFLPAFFLLLPLSSLAGNQLEAG